MLSFHVFKCHGHDVMKWPSMKHGTRFTEQRGK